MQGVSLTMKTAKEIEELLKTNGKEPKDIFEKMYYIPLKNAILTYRRKLISKNELLNQQRELKNVYEQLILWDRVIQKHQKINIALSQVQLCGCGKCKEIEKIMTGRK